MKKIFGTLLMVGALLGSFALGYHSGVTHIPAVEKVTSLSNKTPDSGIVSEKTDFSPFWKAWTTLNEKYVAATSTNDQNKVWGAISGLASSLGDPYTVFFPPAESKSFAEEIKGSFEGIGVEIDIKDGVLTVVAPLKDTPGERAGVRSGDKVLKIDDTTTNGMSVEEAVRRIHGKKGTTVRLTLFREGKRDPFEVSIVRDVIAIPTIATDAGAVKLSGASGSNDELLRKNDIYLIKLYSFSANSHVLFRETLQKFVDSGRSKLILDLRGNPGGYLEAAVDIASWFLPQGTVVVRENFGGKKPEEVHQSAGYNIFANKNLKMIVLINRGSASASEILAGALSEHGVAKLVGERSFGKGSVQELVDITPDTSLKVTVARWLTPNGKSISEGGLTPDVNVKMTQDDLDKKKDPQMDKAIELLKAM